jgi:hypothetical protein
LRVKTTVKAGSWPPSTNHNEAEVRVSSLKVQTSIKAGGWPASVNHNEAGVRAGVRQVKPCGKARPRLKVGSAIKVGSRPGWPPTTNHNEAEVRVPSLKVQTSIKAGGIIINQ